MVAGLCWHFSNFPWLCKVFFKPPSILQVNFATWRPFRLLEVISQPFRSLEVISQRRNIFAAHFATQRWFHSSFRSCEISVRGFEMALVCQKKVSQLRNTLRNGALAAKLEVFTLWDFAAVSQLRNESHCVAKWHSCAKKWFRSCETPFQMASRLWNGGFQGVEVSQPFRSCETRGTVLRNGTRVPKECFAAAKIFAERDLRLRNGFAAKCRFRKGFF